MTDYGKEFYEYVTKCLRYIEQGSAIMKEYSNQISGSISIGGIVSKFDYYAICANTPFLDQFLNLKKLHITDVPLNTRLIYMCYNKTSLHPAIMESFMNYVVTEELQLPG